MILASVRFTAAAAKTVCKSDLLHYLYKSGQEIVNSSEGLDSLHTALKEHAEKFGSFTVKVVDEENTALAAEELFCHFLVDTNKKVH